MSVRASLCGAVLAAGLMLAMPAAYAEDAAANSGADESIDEQLDAVLQGADNEEMIKLAQTNRAAFIGKTLYFTNGQEVGKVDDVKRWNQDHNIYLVVAAKPFFHDDVQFAVPVSDLKGIEGDKVLIREDAGDHLRGMQYYAEDYSSVAAGK